jgi:hypothetical protein
MASDTSLLRRIYTRSTPILIAYHGKIKCSHPWSANGGGWEAYVDIKLLTSLFKGFIGSERIVYKHKQEVGR